MFQEGDIVITTDCIMAFRPSEPAWNDKQFYLSAGTLMKVIGVHRVAMAGGKRIVDLVPFLADPEDDTWASVSTENIAPAPPLVVLAEAAR